MYPAVFINSVPKSGTHLLKQIMGGIPNMKQNPFEFYEGLSQDLALHEAKLQALLEGEFASGHVYYSKEWAALLKRYKIKHLFITRDLRDIVVSYVYFITGPYPYHPLREYMLSMKSRKKQFLTLICGLRTPTLSYPDISLWYQAFHGWVSEPDGMKLTYEQLMSSNDSRKRTLERMIHYLWDNAPMPHPLPTMINAMESNINPSRAYTFRNGNIGNWRKEFDDDVKQSFKQIAGKWLIRDGYEKDNNW